MFESRINNAGSVNVKSEVDGLGLLIEYKTDKSKSYFMTWDEIASAEVPEELKSEITETIKELEQVHSKLLCKCGDLSKYLEDEETRTFNHFIMHNEA